MLQCQRAYLVPCKKALTRSNIYMCQFSHISVYLYLGLYVQKIDLYGTSASDMQHTNFDFVGF